MKQCDYANLKIFDRKFKMDTNVTLSENQPWIEYIYTLKLAMEPILTNILDNEVIHIWKINC